MSPIRIGTRRSRLALWQANTVRDRLRAAMPDTPIELVPIATAGDRVRGPLAAHGGKGLYVKEIEAALQAGCVDLAVHSLKDLPIDCAEGCTLFAVLERADPRDVCCLRAGDHWRTLPPGAVIGTSSLRRQWQMLALRPDCTIAPVRGNVETRLRKLAEGRYDALVMAAAGLARLGLTPSAGVVLGPHESLPAIGQGVIVVEGRAADGALAEAERSACHHEDTGIVVAAERAVMRAVGGDCFTPLAAFARREDTLLRLDGWLATTDGARAVRDGASAPWRDHAAMATVAAALGERVGRSLQQSISA